MRNYTQHAQIRQSQRGIPAMMIDLLLEVGARERAGDGTLKLFFDKRAKKHAKQYAGSIPIDEHFDVYAVVNPDDYRIITVGHRTERIRRKSLKRINRQQQ